jgi:tetratricopeptide (TPR) repeat protein
VNLPSTSFKPEVIMKTFAKFAAIVVDGVVCTNAVAAAPASTDKINGALKDCYRASDQSVAGTNLHHRGVVACNRALHYSPTKELKASALHNRGIIELYAGEEEAAFESWERAVALSDRASVTHFALAQLAYRRGDLARAYELYDTLMKCNLDAAGLAGYKDAIQSNFEVVRTRVQASK